MDSETGSLKVIFAPTPVSNETSYFTTGSALPGRLNLPQASNPTPKLASNIPDGSGTAEMVAPSPNVSL
jgi:hypothetical protein